MGYMKYHVRSHQDDDLKELSDIIREKKDSVALIFNFLGAGFGNIFALLNDQEVINDFIKKENDCSYRLTNSKNIPELEMGFFNINGVEGLKMKGIFSELFLYDRIQELRGTMQHVLDK